MFTSVIFFFPYKAPILFMQSTSHFFVTESHATPPPPVTSFNFVTPLWYKPEEAMSSIYKNLLWNPAKSSWFPIYLTQTLKFHLLLFPFSVILLGRWDRGSGRQGTIKNKLKKIFFTSITYSMSAEWTFEEDERNRGFVSCRCWVA